MATGNVRKRLTKMLASKKQTELQTNSERLENLAVGGNNMAKNVIGLSNQVQLKAVGKLQKKMNIFDAEVFQELRSQVTATQ